MANLRRIAARLDEKLPGVISIALKLSLVAIVWGAAYLDYKEPGFGKFASVPWQQWVDFAKEKSNICPEVDGAIAVPFAPGLANFINADTSLEGIQKSLGKPLCHSEQDKAYVFRLSVVFGQNLLLKVVVNDKALVKSYEILRKKP